MKAKVEKVFQARYFDNNMNPNALNTAIYRMLKNNKWNYNITTNHNPYVFAKEFKIVKSYRAIQTDKTWFENWDDVIDSLDEYVWDLGSPVYCLKEYAEAIIEGLEGRHNDLQMHWIAELGLK